MNTGNVDTKQYNVGQKNFSSQTVTVSVLLAALSNLNIGMAAPAILCPGGSTITNYLIHGQCGKGPKSSQQRLQE